MFKFTTRLFALVVFLGGASFALAQDSGPLIDLLIKKGVINDQEAEELRAELTKDFASTSAGKLNLNNSLTELRIAGDVRIRYESRTGELPTGDHQERDRFRYRFRTGLTGKMLNNWSWGFRFETSTGSRSSNVTMGDDAGPFAKNSDTVNIGQIWAKWEPTPEFSLTLGRMPNPLVSTLMVWDADINPEGIAEKFTRRSGKSEFSLTAAQFLYSAASTQNAFGAASATNPLKDLLLLAWQGGYKHYLEGTATFFQINPTLYTYVRNSTQNPAAFRGNFSASNSALVNNLTVIDVPVEYNWLINGVPARLFGDFAINLDGKDRATKFGRPDLDGENKAWQVGFQYGRATNTGEWDSRLYYMSTGAFALDPNLVDSDLWDSRTNMKGLVFNANYRLGAATQLSLTLAHGSRADDTLIAPGAGDIGSNNLLNKYGIMQLDLVISY